LRSQDVRRTRGLRGLADWPCADVPGLEWWHHNGGTMLWVEWGAWWWSAPGRAGRSSVLKTSVCDLLGIEVPIVQAAI
jgi:hypothetical protein